MRRPPLWTWLLLWLVLGRPANVHRILQADRTAGLRRDLPNVLILVGDDHAAGLMGLDGDPRQATPRLDALAGQGVRFTRAYCQAPVCSASRQSFLTGRYPHAVGVTRLMDALPESAVTLADWFAEAGYFTGAIGKMHFNNDRPHGFAERIDRNDWLRWLKNHPPTGGDHRRAWRPFQTPAAEWLNAANRDAGLPDAAMESAYYADQAAAFLHRHRDGPFLLVVGFPQPHAPFEYPRDLNGRYQPKEFDVPAVSEADRAEAPLVFRDLAPAQVAGIQAAYFNSLSYLDRQVGRVLGALEAAGLADETIVLYLGDNGYFLGQRGRFEKHCMYEPAVRVPLIVRWPGNLPEGRQEDRLVELVDVFPTLTELCGLPDPADLHGRSLAPLLAGTPGVRWRRYAFSEYLENEEAMIRSDRYKLIVSTGRRARRDGYRTANPTPGPSERLYDLQVDPDETTDLSDRSELAGARDELRRALHARLIQTREGLSPVPAGLSGRAAIEWCLVPRSKSEVGTRKSE